MTPRPRLARLVTGIAVAGAVAGGLVVAALAPWPQVMREAVSLEVVPEAARSVAACDGPLLALGRDETAAGAITEAATAGIVSGADGSAAESFTLAAPDLIASAVPPTVFVAEPAGGNVTDLAAASVSTLDDADLRGLAVSACTRPLMESWIVGGSAATGASDVVILTNPGDVAALVDLRVFGATGAQDPVAGQDQVVPPRTQRVIPLAALARGEESPAVRVTAEGAPVRASLQSALTRTLVAGGVDQVAAAAPPALLQVIPAVDVTVGPDSGASAGGMTVRLVAPASVATADVVVRSAADGSIAAQQSGVALTADQPLSLELTGMPVGRYTVTVTADAPLTAAAWTSTDLAAPADFAWSVAAPPVDAPTLVAVAAGPAPALTVSAETDATVTVAPLDGGEGDVLELAAGESRTLAATAGDVLRIDPGDGVVRAAVGFVAPGRIGSYPVTGSAAAAAQLTVYP